MLCSGRKRVVTVKDFHISEDERLKISDKEILELKSSSFTKCILSLIHI